MLLIFFEAPFILFISYRNLFMLHYITLYKTEDLSFQKSLLTKIIQHIHNVKYFVINPYGTATNIQGANILSINW